MHELITMADSIAVSSQSLRVIHPPAHQRLPSTMLSRPSTPALLFFSALLLSAFGYEFVFFVMTVHIYGLDNSAVVIGIFTTLTFVPRLFSSLMGAVGDRCGKAICLSLSALCVALLLYLMSRTAQIDGVYVLWFVASFFLTFIVNARSALMAEIVAREHYASGNAVSLTLLNGAKLLGPLAGGFLSMIIAPHLLLRFASVVYLLTAVVALGIGSPRSTRHAERGLMRTLGQGVRFMRESPAFRQMVAIAFLWRLFLGLQVSLFVVYAKQVLACDNAQYGVFSAMIGVGSIAGSLVGPTVSKQMSPSRLMRVGLSLHYGSFVLLGVCRDYATALGLVFSSYMVFYATLVGMHSARDRMTPDGIRGSAYGTVTAMLTPPAIVSMLVGSYLANWLGVETVLAGAGLLALLSFHLVLAGSRNASAAPNPD